MNEVEGFVRDGSHAELYVAIALCQAAGALESASTQKSPLWVCTCSLSQCKQGGTWQLWGLFLVSEWQVHGMGMAKHIRTLHRILMSLVGMQGAQDQESEDLSQLSRMAWHGAEVFHTVDSQDLAALVEGVRRSGAAPLAAAQSPIKGVRLARNTELRARSSFARDSRVSEDEVRDRH